MKFTNKLFSLFALAGMAGALTTLSAATATAPAVAGDGRVANFAPSNSGCGLSGWQTARLATSGEPDYTSATRTMFAGSGCYGFASMAVGRGFFVFDTSSIPAGATITGVQLSVYITGKQAIGDGKDFISVVQGLQSSTTALAANDYILAGSALTGSVEGSNRAPISAMAINAYHQWTLNTAGLAWVTKGGLTKLALRVGNDLLDVMPNQAAGKGNFISAALAESGAGKAPYLTITYTTTTSGGGSTTPAADVTGPTVALTSPGASSSITGPVSVTASASDASGVAGITFKVDGNTVGAEDTTAPYTMTWDSSTTANGQHQITAIARDTANNVSTSSAVTVSVNNNVAPSTGTIQVNPAVTFQTMNGWEITDQAGQANSNYAMYKDSLLQQAVNDLGINRIRLEWKNTTGTAVDFALIDANVAALVNPLRTLLQNRGEKLIVNLCYVGFGNNGNTYRTNPSGYAAGLLSVFRHLQSKYGWTPDYVEIALEPDNASMAWSGAQVATNLVAAGDALTAAGFTPKYIAPSTTNGPMSRTYFDAIAQNSKALQYLSVLSYHRYVNADATLTASIANRAKAHNKETAMLEWIGATDKTLHMDLKIGNNSAWQQFTLAFPTTDNGAQYYVISGTTNPVVTMGSRTKLLRQYFKFIRNGAVRVDAVSGNSTFDPVAFRHPNGKFVVVVQASAGGSFSIGGLPAGTYGITYSTPTQYNVSPADVTITAGKAVSASIPSAGVITIYAR